jgi:hypothetical protein
MMSTLYKDLRVFLRPEVTGWGIPSLPWLPWLLWLPWLKIKGQILANMPELLHCVHFRTKLVISTSGTQIRNFGFVGITFLVDAQKFCAI